jgi:hypothetical protein
MRQGPDQELDENASIEAITKALAALQALWRRLRRHTSRGDEFSPVEQVAQ